MQQKVVCVSSFQRNFQCTSVSLPSHRHFSVPNDSASNYLHCNSLSGHHIFNQCHLFWLLSTKLQYIFVCMGCFHFHFEWWQVHQERTLLAYPILRMGRYILLGRPTFSHCVTLTVSAAFFQNTFSCSPLTLTIDFTEKWEPFLATAPRLA